MSKIKAGKVNWWTDAVGYQVYVPSFQDSDGDGWGDLPGVTARLGYLADLGVDIVWLTPFFVSPMRDHGYDISDYRHVDPRFGGDAALDALLEEAHRRGLKVIGDLVVNHSSDQHPWFQAAKSDPTGPFRDYYIWRDPAPGGGPPNNWLSLFGGPAWTFEPKSGQYYLHLFLAEQPDLNWHNPKVVDEVDAIMEHWLGRGLDGFRVDTAAFLLKHADLPDNPLLPPGEPHPVLGASPDWRLQDHVYDIHQPEVHQIHARWRRRAERHDAFLVGEIYELDPVALAAFVTEERLHSSFYFGLLDSAWDPVRIRTALRGAVAASPRLSWVQANHDRARPPSRYGGGAKGVRRAMALHVLSAFLPGATWLYQGEELGLFNGAVSADHAADPLAAADPSQSRDVARTPMPWAPGPGLGFTTGSPWLPEGGRTDGDTVALQLEDPQSSLQAVRRLLATRRILFGRPHLAHGLEWHDDLPGDLVVYRRGPATVAVNLGEVPVALPAREHPIVFDSDDASVSLEQPGKVAMLAPYQAVIAAAS